MQNESFFDEAVIDADGTLVGVTRQTKFGIDIPYQDVGGYHTLLVSLANTGAVLRLYNRS